MEIDFGVIDSMVRAKLEHKIDCKESLELLQDMYEENNVDYIIFKAMIESCEGELDACCNLLDLLILFVPGGYKLPKDRNRAFSVKVDVESFKNLVGFLHNEVLMGSKGVKFNNKEVILSENIDEKLLEKGKGKNMEEVDSTKYYEYGVISVYEWIDIFLDNMMTSYEGGDNYFE